MAAWSEFAEQLADASGVDIGYRQDGGLRIAQREEQLDELAAARAAMLAAGIENTPLDRQARACARSPDCVESSPVCSRRATRTWTRSR